MGEGGMGVPCGWTGGGDGAGGFAWRWRGGAFSDGRVGRRGSHAVFEGLVVGRARHAGCSEGARRRGLVVFYGDISWAGG